MVSRKHKRKHRYSKKTNKKHRNRSLKKERIARKTRKNRMKYVMKGGGKLIKIKSDGGGGRGEYRYESGGGDNQTLHGEEQVVADRLWNNPDIWKTHNAEGKHEEKISKDMYNDDWFTHEFSLVHPPSSSDPVPVDGRLINKLNDENYQTLIGQYLEEGYHLTARHHSYLKDYQPECLALGDKVHDFIASSNLTYDAGISYDLLLN